MTTLYIDVKGLTGDVPVEHCLKINVNGETTLDIEGAGHFTDSTLAENLGTHKVLPVGSHDVYFASGTYSVKVEVGRQIGIGGNPQPGAFETRMPVVE